ncbi:MAG: hypothetical protein KC964_19035 [Candidatus Omnitrophica bacterium]|nr:hypothetical protein [Candidatus Omnitrophota bacterium]
MMKTNSICLSVCLLFGGLLLQIEEANARGRGIPIPIFFGSGEKVIHLADLPKDVKREFRMETGHEGSLGFLYERFHIFYLDIWTWNGRYVLYEDELYYEISSEFREALLTSGVKGFRKPILYTFPIGGILLVLIVVAAIGFPRLFPSPESQVRRLFNDERYQEAITLYSNKVRPSNQTEDGNDLEATPPEKAFESAVEHLEKKGIEHDEAQRNLQIMFQILASNSQRMSSR